MLNIFEGDRQGKASRAGRWRLVGTAQTRTFSPFIIIALASSRQWLKNQNLKRKKEKEASAAALVHWAA